MDYHDILYTGQSCLYRVFNYLTELNTYQGKFLVKDAKISFDEGTVSKKKKKNVNGIFH